ncbi:MAG TPA: DUF6502 family protein [Caldimonas sp.]|nr:DUF6502 family protein [Caldimonas sp.]
MPTARNVTADPTSPALVAALARLFDPIARLCLARGLRFAAVEELLKKAFVEAARSGGERNPVRDVSRVSAATGLTRREVTRISQDVTARAAAKPSPATQIFTRWLGNKRLHDERGRPRPLPRQGRAPSFETLAQAVTQDVHPRTLLEELCRLGLAKYDAKTDTVRLVRDSFVPRKDDARMLGFLGANAGDHLAAAVANVLGEASIHLEQAVFADELSEESTAKLRPLVAARWKELLEGLAPSIQELIDADAKAGRVADRRVRVGLYSYHAPMADTAEPSED